MKIKLVSLFLALTMLAGMGSVYTAADDSSSRIVGTTGSASIGVSGVYEAADEPATVYCVKIEWEDMTFSYTLDAGGNRVWNPQTHSYLNYSSYEWKGDQTKQVTVTNCSNKSVNVNAELKEASDTHNIKCTVQPAKFENIPVGDPDTEVEENAKIFNVSVMENKEGLPDFDAPNNFNVGTLTLTVSATAE